ncbi:aminotransferase class V-fold PLP-dependent enzyme [bacterium]|nr:aminotransferase class V-fold PLP-dependent enzyme [bacterium]
MSSEKTDRGFGNIKAKIISGVLKGAKVMPFSKKIFKTVQSVPFVQKKIQKGIDGMMGELFDSIRPYKDQFPVFTKLPEEGRARTEIIGEMEYMRSSEDDRWKDGFVSGAVYHGDKDHIEFLNKVYALNSQTNPLHSDLWPSTTKFEAEIVSMTANMMNSDKTEDSITGTVSSGGTESILLAMKSYRDFAEKKRGITSPEMIVPVSAHAAFDKASQYFKIKMIHVPVDKNFKADVEAARRAITENTIVMVGSAPSFPHGIVDPIEEMSEIARQHGIGFHTDACLGGFVLPWAEKLGYQVPKFDFRLPGVTSISADTHKYGYAAKGTSVILYRGKELQHFQYYKTADWLGGLYFSPTFAGSRAGALSCACWAAMLSIGKKGYMDATRKILETADAIKKGIGEIPELNLMGNPLWVIAFTSKDHNIYKVMDYMTKKKWNLNGLQKPACIHLCITLRHTQAGVAERFIEDLKAAVKYVKKNPDFKGNMAPIYGLVASMPVNDIAEDFFDSYLDMLYKP